MSRQVCPRLDLIPASPEDGTVMGWGSLPAQVVWRWPCPASSSVPLLACGISARAEAPGCCPQAPARFLLQAESKSGQRKGHPWLSHQTLEPRNARRALQGKPLLAAGQPLPTSPTSCHSKGCWSPKHLLHHGHSGHQHREQPPLRRCCRNMSG